MRMSTRDAPTCATRGRISALLARGVSTIIRASHAIALAPTTRANTATSTVSMRKRERKRAKRAVLPLSSPLSICVCGLPSGCAAWQRHFVLIINYVCLLAVSHGSTTTSLPLHLPPASLPLPQPGLACSFKHANDLTINYAK